MDKKPHHHQSSNHLIGRIILQISAFLFSLVLIFTVLTLLSYNDNSSNNKSHYNDEPNLGFTLKDDSTVDKQQEIKNKSFVNSESNQFEEASMNDLTDHELNLIKEDRNLQDFIDTLNSILVQQVSQQSERNINTNDHSELNKKSKNSTSPEQFKLEQNWQKNELKIGSAQRLRRMMVSEEGEYDNDVVNKQPVGYRAKSYREEGVKNFLVNPTNTGPIRKDENIYSDDDYHDKLEKYNRPDNMVDVVYRPNNEFSDRYDDDVKYYLIKKVHNRINLASYNEVKGLNELINDALINQERGIKNQVLHLSVQNQIPNVYVSSKSPNPIHSNPNLIPQSISNYPPHEKFRDNYLPNQSNMYSHDAWGWNSWDKPIVGYAKMTVKQKVKIKFCRRMLRRVRSYPTTILMPVYNGKTGWSP